MGVIRSALLVLRGGSPGEWPLEGKQRRQRSTDDLIPHVTVSNNIFKVHYLHGVLFINKIFTLFKKVMTHAGLA